MTSVNYKIEINTADDNLVKEICKILDKHQVAFLQTREVKQ